MRIWTIYENLETALQQKYTEMNVLLFYKSSNG